MNQTSGHRIVAWMKSLGHPRSWGRRRIYTSLQARAVSLAVLLALIFGVVFSLASLLSIRNSLQDQVSAQAQRDFSNQVARVQEGLDAAQMEDQQQYQSLITNLASSFQNDGAVNLVGVFMWGSGRTANSVLVPVSTDPTVASLISESMRSAVSGGSCGGVCYQPINLKSQTHDRAPGAVLGTVLNFSALGDLELFAVYSYASQQQSVMQIQLSMLIVIIVLCLLLGIVVWCVMRSVIRPVERVAVAAESVALGQLNARVDVNRHDEIGILQRSFNEMASSLDEKIEELEKVGTFQRRFVSDVSHELRTPVTTIRMASDLLESRKSSFEGSTARTVELLSGQINRFEKMLADLLEISRYDAGYAAVDLVEGDLRETVNSAVIQVGQIAEAKGVPIAVLLPQDPVISSFDSRRITRIIRNLLINGIDFAEGKPIEVHMACNRQAVAIAVRDHGTGMAPEQLAHVFDRFWRADASRARTTGGSGLGLAIAMSDARLHGGGIELRSAPDLGTCFLVTLPRDGLHEVPESAQPLRFRGDEELDPVDASGAGIYAGRSVAQADRKDDDRGDV